MSEERKVKAAADSTSAKGATAKDEAAGSAKTAAKSSDQASGLWKRALAAIVIAAVCAAGVLAGVSAALPAQSSVDSSLSYNYVYSGDKSQSVDFCSACMNDNTLLMFGSSELAVAGDVAQSPAYVFGSSTDALNVMYIGEAYDQDLWQAIAAGAYAGTTSSNKIAIIVSPGWFEDAGLESGIFKLRFSYELYERFCENSQISDETKSYVRQRLLEEGIDEATVDSASTDTPIAIVNRGVYSFMANLHLRQSLTSVREWGTPCTADGTIDVDTIDFSALYDQAVATGASRCTNNDYGIEDGYWNDYLAADYETLAGSKAGETLSNETEMADFDCFLRVCRDAGLEPLVIIQPYNGAWYDYVGIGSDVRQACYARIQTKCDEYGVETLNLADTEYEPYAMHDIMHMGWTNWVRIDEALVNFTRDDGKENS